MVSPHFIYGPCTGRRDNKSHTYTVLLFGVLAEELLASDMCSSGVFGVAILLIYRLLGELTSFAVNRTVDAIEERIIPEPRCPTFNIIGRNAGPCRPRHIPRAPILYIIDINAKEFNIELSICSIVKYVNTWIINLFLCS
jgi:hypothetical protein